MSDDTGTETNQVNPVDTETKAANPVSPPNNPPQQPSQSQPSHTSNPSVITELRDAIAAIPEQVINAINEARPQPTTRSRPASTEGGETRAAERSQREPEKAKTPGVRNFAQWWFD